MTEQELAPLRLNLAPKLKRPLSLWNPLDYLRLLFWVFYFPQGLRWYVDHFGKGHIADSRLSFQKRWQLLRKHPNHRNLLIQGFLITITIPALILACFQLVNSYLAWNNWLLSVALATALGLTIGLTLSMVVGLEASVVLGVTSSIALGLFPDISKNIFDFPVLLGVVFGVSFGVIVGLAGGYAGRGAFGHVGRMVLIIALIVALVIGTGKAVSESGHIVDGWTSALLFCAVFMVAFALSVLRLDGWLLGSLTGLLLFRKSPIFAISVTPLTVFTVPLYLRKTLRKDWNLGIHNINQLFAFTYQYIAILDILDYELTMLSQNTLIAKIAQLVESPLDWDLVRYCSVSLGNTLKSTFFEYWYIFPFGKKFSSQFNINPRLNPPSRATAAGFWYLYSEQPAAASQAFAVVRDIRHGEEMHSLASLLAMFEAAATAEAIAAIELPEFPEDRTLRPRTWEAIRRFCHVISDTKTVELSSSRSARAFATNRALGELQHILDYEHDLPEAERRLVINIAKAWRSALLDVTAEVGDLQITQPIRNPYVVGDPVEGDLFVGRDDIMRQLQEHWLMGNHLQSVVLYGHRRMGKTSILKNVSRVLGANVKVAYVNLLKVSWAETIGDVLTAVTDQVAAVLEIEPPSDADMAEKPGRTFDRFLQQAIASLTAAEGLIIAIDEFEKIEELIEAGKLDPGFLGYLRGLLQDSPKLAFAFAGLHTLEEMSADYFQPFYASVLPIKVDFFKPSTVQALLPNPNSDFPLDYDFHALDLIWELTAGQPYLTQLVGFQLVRCYNDQVFERNQKRAPRFTAEDVRAVVERPEFFNQGKQYFMGVWAQANHHNDPPGQHAILKALAPHAEGVDIKLLWRASDLQEDAFNAALGTLENHDVIRRDNGTVRIIVELFRRWLVSYSGLMESS